MKKCFLLIALCTLYSLSGQIPQIEWQRVFGGSKPDAILDVEKTSDQGYIMVGETGSADGDVTGWHEAYYEWGAPIYDGWVIKVDAEGQLEWEKAIGGYLAESLNEVKQTSDGGYIIAGSSNSNDGDVSGHHGTEEYSDCWIIKLNSEGDIQWQRSIGGTETDAADAILETVDGGYLFTAYTFSNDGDVTEDLTSAYADIWLVKLDEMGNIQWQQMYGSSTNDFAVSLQQTPDGGYIFAGAAGANDGDVSGWHEGYDEFGSFFDAWVVKLNNAGEIEWQKCIGGSSIDFARSVQSTSDGGYIVGIETSSNDGDISGWHEGYQYGWPTYDFGIVKLNSLGEIQWAKAFGGTQNEYIYQIKELSNGDYIAVGVTTSNDGDVTGWHEGYNNGDPMSDMWIVKLNNEGELIWQKAFGSSNGDGATDIIEISETSFLVTGVSGINDGDVEQSYGLGDAWVLLINSDLSTNDIETSKLIIHPNPVKDILNFSEKLNNIEIYSLSGKKLINKSEAQSIHVETLPIGTYILKAKDQKGKTITQKFIKK